MKPRYSFLYVLPCVIFILSMAIFPLIYSFILSFCSWNLAVPGGEISFKGLSNYIHLIHESRFWDAVGHTLYIVGAAVCLEFMLGLLLAVLIAKVIRGRKFIVAFFLLPLAVTPVAIAHIWRLLFRTGYGPVNYFLSILRIEEVAFLSHPVWVLPAIIVTDIWQWTPFMMLILLAGLQSVPEGPLEAAKVDGASRWQIFKYVTLPFMKPIIAIAILIRVMDTFKIFDKVWIMTFGGPGSSSETLSIYIYKLAFRFWDIGRATSLSYLMLIVIIILSSSFLRIIRE